MNKENTYNQINNNIDKLDNFDSEFKNLIKKYIV